MASASRPTMSRRMFAVVATSSLAVAGLAAAAAPSSAANPVVQSVRFSVSTGGPAYTSTAIKADFTLTNPSTNTGSVAAFTIEVPAGVGRVTGAGVTGPGNWREAPPISCGRLPKCSSLVVVYASLPLSTSVLKPGKSLTASIAFTTPSAPTSLPFHMIGIGNGIFTTPDVPTITVVSGDPAGFVLTDPALAAATPPNSTQAGQTQTFTLQAQNKDGANVPYGPASVNVQLGADDSQATLQLGNGPATSFTGSPSVVGPLSLPFSATGTYQLAITFRTAAAPTSVTVTDVAKPTVKGMLSGFSVLAGPPQSIGLDSIRDASQTPPLPNPAKGQPFAASFHLADQFGNPTTLQGSSVVLNAPGPGSLGAQTVVDSDPAADPPTLGTVTTTYSQAVPPISFTLTLGSPQIAGSNAISSPVDGSGASTSLSPGTSGVLTPSCSLGSDDSVCSTASFPNGANGQVVVVQQLCQPGDRSICASNPGAPVLTLVQGDFTGLYSNWAPAKVTLTCPVARCPDRDDGDFETDHSAEEVAEAIAQYPGWAQSSAPPLEGGSQPWVQLGACHVPDPTAAPGSPGSYIVPAGALFCSDHGSYHFDSAGNLSLTLYFLVDPKGGP